MGCGASKSGEGAFMSLCKSEGCLVSLCKERKDLIRAARESRNAVSASHVLYLQSLLNFGEALDVFLKDAVTVVASVDSLSCSSEADSPLHSIEGSHLEFSSEDSESVILGSLTDEVHQGDKDGKTKLSSPKDSADNCENEIHISERKNVNCMVWSSPEVVTVMRDPDSAPEFPASVGVEYMHKQHMHHHLAQHNFWHPSGRLGAHSSGTARTYYYNGYNYSDYGDGSSSSYAANFASQGQRFGDYGSERHMGYSRDTGSDNRPHAPPNPKPIPIPSPPIANFTKDYFDFFSFTDDIYSSHYSGSIFDDRVGSKHPYLNYVLEEEGMPPLEEIGEEGMPPLEEIAEEGIPPLEEIVKDSSSEPSNMSKEVKDTQPEVQPVETDKGHMAAGDKEYNGNCQVEEMNHVNTSVEIEKDVDVASTNNMGDDKIIDKTELSGQMKQALVPKRPVNDIFEAIQEIKHAFLTSYNSGKEVAEILEAEKIPYLQTDIIQKGCCNTVIGAIAPSTVSLQTAYAHHKKSASKILERNDGSSYLVKDISYKHGMMTSTLDKLYIWEKKLYKEVKIEEELRRVYEKLCKRSQMLVNKGAESDKIEAVQLKIKELLHKIDVSVSAVHAISRHIHQTMDEELHPQISGLTLGLSRMWKSMSQCHQNQAQAATDAKEQNNVAKIEVHLDLRHTEDLKLKVLRWRSGLSDLINTQKEFVTFLVDWLSKYRRDKKETGEDGSQPSSTFRVEDPDVAVICCGWLHALESTPVFRASDALEEFALTLYNLWAKQSEEQALKIQMEFLEGRIHSSTGHAENHLQVGSSQELNTARKYLEELKVTHAEVFDQVRSVASNCLTNGLIKVFSELESFCTDMSNAYDQISIS